jgi:hypothetical protein
MAFEVGSHWWFCWRLYCIVDANQV